MAALQYDSLVQCVFRVNFFPYGFRSFGYGCVCLNGDLVAAVLRSPFTSTVTQRCLPKVVSHLGLNAHPPNPSRKVEGRGCLSGAAGPASVCGAGGRWHPPPALPRGSRSVAFTPLLLAVHGLPQRQGCVSQPCPACRFPLGESLTAGSPEKKSCCYPFFTYKCTCPPRPATRPPAACHWLWDHPAVYEFLPTSTPV